MSFQMSPVSWSNTGQLSVDSNNHRVVFHVQALSADRNV
jgi:hypothetical protein